MRDKPKIAFFLYKLSGGGLERVASELSLNLPKNINQIVVLLEKKISYSYKAKLISLDITPPKIKLILIRIFKFFERLYKFKKVIRRENPDLVISFGGGLTCGLNVLNVLATSKAILTVHNRPSNDKEFFFDRFIHKLLIKIFYNKAQNIIAVSKGIKIDLENNFGIKKGKIKVIYNPIDITKIQELSQEKIEHSWFKENILTIITYGSLTEQKGQWHLIRAFSEVRKQVFCRLIILGAGKLKKYLKELTKKLKLENDILFLDWQENPFKFIAKSDVFVLPSLWEGLSMAILEAMSCGLPVISSDCLSGPREILAPDTDIDYQARDIEYAQYGILTPTCDGKFYQAEHSLTKEERILSKVIVAILKNKRLKKQYEKKSFERARDFDIYRIINYWLRLFRI